MLAAIPRSTRWLVAEAAQPPAFTTDGIIRSGLKVLRPKDDTLRMADEDDDLVLASKRRALDEHSTLYVSDGLASTAEAEDETMSLVEAAIGVAGDPWHHGRGLDVTARLVRDDLVLLRQEGDSTADVCAACVCFSFGQLQEKLGRPLATVHAPVPGYVDSLGRPLDRVFAKLTPDRPLWRSNFEFRWSGELLHPSATSGDPTAKGDLTHATSSDGGNGCGIGGGVGGPSDMHLRVEYQTLRRLPRSRHILFTIRSYIDPLAAVAASPAAASALADRVAALSPAFAEYKGIDAEMRPRIASYLASGGQE